MLLLIGTVVILIVWKVPVFQVARSKSLTEDNRFDRENEARKTLAQIIGGVFVLAGLYSSVQTFDLSRQGQITDRFTKAIDQLGASSDGKPKLEVRLGGIFALERIARDSERDHQVIMEVLATYVRQNSSPRQVPGAKEQHDPPPLQADTQAIMNVFGRRDPKYDSEFIDLTKAYLYRAHLAGSRVPWGLFGGADLRDAYCLEADFRNANFTAADLRFAHLEDANLSHAQFRNAHLAEASLEGADLSDADLTQWQLDGTSGDDRTKLPERLKRPASWTIP